MSKSPLKNEVMEVFGIMNDIGKISRESSIMQDV